MIGSSNLTQDMVTFTLCTWVVLALLPAGVEEISTPRPGLYLAEEVRRLRARLELLERKLERIEAPRRRY